MKNIYTWTKMHDIKYAYKGKRLVEKGNNIGKSLVKLERRLKIQISSRSKKNK